MILLDTYAWIWWASAPHLLSTKARRAIDTSHHLAISAISCWEVAMLVEKERIVLDREVSLWLKQALALPRVKLLPLSPEIAVRSTQLGKSFHQDPADRMIVATALEHEIYLLTKDKNITRSSLVKTIW